MGKKRIVLDTNILISAFGWHGKPKEIFSKVLNKEFELIIIIFASKNNINFCRKEVFQKFRLENKHILAFFE